MAYHRAPVGVFDSGIGGLSILKALRERMPHEHFVYFADSAHNPYGEKSEAFVIERSIAIAHQLVHDHGIKALVVACNTATAAAIHLLRAEHPLLPIVGVEPALKPAVAISKTKRIAVLATRGTLQSAKFASLIASLKGQAEFTCMPCDGLAEHIERSVSEQDTTKLIAACAHYIRATGRFGTENAEIDTLVLGCTHYPLVLPFFTDAVGPAVHMVDNGQAVAQRTQQLLAEHHTVALTASASLTLLTSADNLTLEHAARRFLTDK